MIEWVTVEVYETRTGQSPLLEWLSGLRDVRARQRIIARIDAAAEGNLGDWRPLAHGLFEMRVFHGPGYRIYFARDGAKLILLLCGGSKGTQRRDIAQARAYLNDYRQRKHGAH